MDPFWTHIMSDERPSAEWNPKSRIKNWTRISYTIHTRRMVYYWNISSLVLTSYHHSMNEIKPKTCFPWQACDIWWVVCSKLTTFIFNNPPQRSDRRDHQTWRGFTVNGQCNRNNCCCKRKSLPGRDKSTVGINLDLLRQRCPYHFANFFPVSRGGAPLITQCVSEVS